MSNLRVDWNAGGDFGPADPEIIREVASAAAALVEAGCQVEEVSIPGLVSGKTNEISLAVYGGGGISLSGANNCRTRGRTVSEYKAPVGIAPADPTRIPAGAG